MKRPRVRERRSYPGDGTTSYFSAGETQLEYYANWWLTFLQTFRANPKRRNWKHEDLVLHWIGQYKQTSVFVADITEAARRNDIRFFRDLGRVLTHGRKADFDNI